MPRLRFTPYALLGLVLVATAGLVAADPNDWVNVNYVLKQAGMSDTAGARQTIVNKAGSSAKSGPLSIVTKNSVKPPSGDVHDHLSWAPYHWPQCNWCSKGTNHLSGSARNHTSADDGNDTGDGDSFDGNDPYENGGVDDNGKDSVNDYELLAANVALLSRDVTPVHGAYHGLPHRRMLRRRRSHISRASEHSGQRRQDVDDGPELRPPLDDSPVPTLNAPPLPTGGIPSAPGDDAPPLPIDDDPSSPVDDPSGTVAPPDVGDTTTTTSSSQTTTIGAIKGTPAPAQAPARTTKGSTGTKCTPSPAKSLAPSATWTTCPYVVRDGKLNPDVRTLPDTLNIQRMSQAVLYNAVAFAIGKTKSYSQNAAKFIDVFFLSPDTAMNPNMNYGQQVRGPGKAQQMGTYSGILDIRGLVKVVNAIQVLKAAGSPDWTTARDKAMTAWMKSYITWLDNSALGKEVAQKANNHYTFFVSQLAAAKMYIGDTQGAQATMKNYFAHQFKDQIAASGEQPFEAVRTRPYHYRCFNLEAMITIAKMGDQLGMNFWTSKSKYDATIQTALDYVMQSDPKSEDIAEVIPHVAAIAAAYGDPKGKYAAFLQKHGGDYKNQPFWFYDQSEALRNSPAGQAKHRRDIGIADMERDLPSDISTGRAMAVDAASDVGSGKAPFECPAVFKEAKMTELDNGIYTTCDGLRPYYELELPVDPNVV